MSKDLARALSVTNVRVVEVIPGKNVIGIEIPNENKQIVRLSEIIKSEQFEKSTSKLTIGLGKDICDELANNTEYYNKPYAEDGIVYSSAERCLENPGKFHLIPHNVRMNAGALAVYLAAFDNHKNIYMIGYEGQHGGPGYNSNIYAGTPGYAPKDHTGNSEKWERNMCKIFSAYPDISFTIVDNNINGYPDDYKWYKNVRKIDYRDFVSELDLGSFNHRSTD